MRHNTMIIASYFFFASFGTTLTAQSAIEKEHRGPAMRDILDEEGQEPSSKPLFVQEEEQSEPLPGRIEERESGQEPDENTVRGKESDIDFANQEKEEKKKEDDEKASWINEYVDFGGAIEVEAFWREDYDGHHHSDIVLEAAELDFEVHINDWSLGLLSIEWEPDDERVTIKEAYVTLGDTKCYPYFITFGRLFVPFGIGTGAVVGDTLTVTDPLTIEIFETREDVIMVGYHRNRWLTAAYVFNGDTNGGRGVDDHIEQYGATLRYGFEYPNYSMSAGIDYISSVFDSDNLSEVFPGAFFARYAPGIAVHFRYFRNGFHFIAEYNGALRSASFDVEEIIEGPDGEEIILHDVSLQPQAWMIELGYITEICCRRTYVAMNYSESYDLDGFFPRRRFLIDIGRWIFEESILLALEYGHDWDYSESRDGTGETSNFVVFQMAYEW